MVLKGCVVTEYAWINPHSLIKFDYKTEKGAVQHWAMEIRSESTRLNSSHIQKSRMPSSA